ncbi:MAG: hypothetical protein IPF58_15385 [Saprospirales bacterium]|nr:hypothetical protein [Saprospirales bacterium]
MREHFSNVVKEGFKGSGDYGVVAVGVYNGQTANKPELNKAPHVVLYAYPFKIKSDYRTSNSRIFWKIYNCFRFIDEKCKS